MHGLVLGAIPAIALGYLLEWFVVWRVLLGVVVCLVVATVYSVLSTATYWYLDISVVDQIVKKYPGDERWIAIGGSQVRTWTTSATTS